MAEGLRFQAPIAPAAQNFELAAGHMSQGRAKDVEMLPRTTLVAQQIGAQECTPSSFFRDLKRGITVSRLLPFYESKQKLDKEKRRNDFIRGIIVTKPEAASDTSDKPKDR